MTEEDLTWKEKYQALKRVAAWRPKFTFGLVIFSAAVALLEGIGLGFIHPIMEIAQHGVPEDPGTIMTVFLSFYEFLGIPFSLGYLIIGVSLVMTFRYTMTFLVGWLKAIISKSYERELRERTFKSALNGKIAYFDQEGSDDILNAIITETRYSSSALSKGIGVMERVFLVIMYLCVMLYISPLLTALAVLVLGGITLLLRYIVEPAVTVGKRVAKANQKVQESVQAGTQGIRDVKLFGLTEEIYSKFNDSINTYTKSEIKLMRNKAAINNFYKISASITLFALIYVGFTYTQLGLGELGIFLIAMFQLAPRVSDLNSELYKLEGKISHLVRTQQFLEELNEREEQKNGKPIKTLGNLEFENVDFSYEEEEKVLKNVSFESSKNQFTAFVGESGAGKSTIVSLITRMYSPEKGKIKANNSPIDEYDLKAWRERIAVVRQDPYIFNTTLKENITIGNREADKEEIMKVCRIAKVDEFLQELPKGLQSELGDEGVRLSGGQKQRVALARALLKDADFLILDEATSNLDSRLEKQVQSSIEDMEKNYGIIAIAHRLSTVENADTIHVLDQGKIIEKGPHNQLMNKQGKYAELYNIQSKEETRTT